MVHLTGAATHHFPTSTSALSSARSPPPANHSQSRQEPAATTGWQPRCARPPASGAILLGARPANKALVLTTANRDLRSRLIAVAAQRPTVGWPVQSDRVVRNAPTARRPQVWLCLSPAPRPARSIGYPASRPRLGGAVGGLRGAPHHTTSFTPAGPPAHASLPSWLSSSPHLGPRADKPAR